MICFLNGRYIPLRKAGVGLYDLGLLRGYTVFEVMRTYNGKLFMFDDHFRRFQNSAAEVDLKIPYPKMKLEAIIKNILARNGFRKGKEAVIRVIMTGGISYDTVHINKNPTFYILTEPFVPMPDKVYKKGISIPIKEFVRDIPEAKTANYIQGIRILNRNPKAHEVLFTNGDNILEASTSNFFIIKSNSIITPKIGVLHGITRRVLLKLAGKFFKIEERNVTKKEMFSADEAFLTATNKKVVPVVKIGGRKIGRGIVGEGTKKLMRIFDSHVSAY